MSENERLLVAALLKNPGRHEARLVSVDPEWIQDRITRAFFKLLKTRSFSFTSIAKFLSHGEKNKALRQSMLEALPSLEQIDSLEDADVDYAASTLISRAKQAHLLDRVRWALDCIEEEKLKKAEEVVTVLSDELRGFDLGIHAPRDIASLAQGTLTECKAAVESGGAFIRTGYKRIDMTLGGGKLGEMWLVGGYSGEGKSFASLNLAYHVWETTDRNVVWIPNEMSVKTMSMLFVARHSATLFPESPLKTKAMLEGTLTDKEEIKLRKTIQDIKVREAKRKRWHIWRPKRGSNIRDIGSYLEGQRYKMGVDLLVIDYLEQLPAIRERKGGREELNDTLGEAKYLAENYNNGRGLWLLSPHQINRQGKAECEKRKPTPHYVMSDLAESARAERDADVVLWVLRTEKLESIHQLLIGAAKARGSDRRDLRYGVKFMEGYGSAYIGNLADEESAPIDNDFDEIG